jgi:hypothetical protein
MKRAEDDRGAALTERRRWWWRFLMIPVKRRNSGYREGPEKVTRGGVNVSQSKLHAGTRPISQNRPDDPLF